MSAINAASFVLVDDLRGGKETRLRRGRRGGGGGGGLGEERDEAEARDEGERAVDEGDGVVEDLDLDAGPRGMAGGEARRHAAPGGDEDEGGPRSALADGEEEG